MLTLNLQKGLKRHERMVHYEACLQLIDHDHDPDQLKREDFLILRQEGLRDFSIRLLDDLIEAREHLNRNSHHSSRPPGSEAPWEKQRTAVDGPTGFEETGESVAGDGTRTELPEDSDRKSEEIGQKNKGRRT